MLRRRVGPDYTLPILNAGPVHNEYRINPMFMIHCTYSASATPEMPRRSGLKYLISRYCNANTIT